MITSFISNLDNVTLARLALHLFYIIVDEIVDDIYSEKLESDLQNSLPLKEGPNRELRENLKQR